MELVLSSEVRFRDIKRCSYQQGKTPDIDSLDNRPEETLYVEATGKSLSANMNETFSCRSSISNTVHDAGSTQQRLFASVAILFGVMFSVFILEAVLRLVSPPWLAQRMQELNVGNPYEIGSDQTWPVIREGGVFRQFVPNSKFMVRHYEYEHTANIDEFGGRATPHRPDVESIIPFMGDSFTFGVGVRDDETFVSQLGSQSKYRLLNLGVPGSALHNQLDILEMRHTEVGSPGFYIFCFFMGNDLTDIRRRYESSSSQGSDEGADMTRGWLWKINHFVYHNPFLKKLYSVQYGRQKVLAILNRRKLDLANPLFLAMRSDSMYLDESLTYLRRELTRLKRISITRRFRYAFVLIPDIHQVSRDRLKTKAAYYNLDLDKLNPHRVGSAISSMLTEFKIPHADIESCLSKAIAIDRLYYVQDNHLTASGHSRAADCIRASGLLQLGSFPSSHGSSRSLSN